MNKRTVVKKNVVIRKKPLKETQKTTCVTQNSLIINVGHNPPNMLKNTPAVLSAAAAALF